MRSCPYSNRAAPQWRGSSAFDAMTRPRCGSARELRRQRDLRVQNLGHRAARLGLFGDLLESAVVVARDLCHADQVAMRDGETIAHLLETHGRLGLDGF